MKFFIVLSALAAVALAKPGHLLASSGLYASPFAYAVPQVGVKLVPGAPIGHDGRVVDTPEVAYAKAEHQAAHLNEKVTLAQEAVKSADLLTYASAPSAIVTSYQPNAYASLPVGYEGALPAYQAVGTVAYAKLVPAAPLGADGRVVDTLEVAHAKAEHSAAHLNEKLALAHEEAKSADYYALPHVQLVSAFSSGSYAPALY